MKYTNTQDVMIYIRQQMFASRVTISELATRLDKAPAAVSATFNRKNITLETLNDICKALGYDLEINLTPMLSQETPSTEQSSINIAKAARRQAPLNLTQKQLSSFIESAKNAPDSSDDHNMF